MAGGGTVLTVSLLLLSSGFPASSAIIVRQCERNSGNWANELTVTCSADERIRFVRIMWGREHPAVDGNGLANETFCPDSNDNVDDTSMCTSELHWWRDNIKNCQDQTSSCTLSPTTDQFGDPCPGQYKYLEVEYICTKCPPEKFGSSCEHDLSAIDFACLAVKVKERQNCSGAYEKIKGWRCKKLLASSTERGCCFDRKIKKVPFCFEPLSAVQVKYTPIMYENNKDCRKILDDGLARTGCGYKGITEITCRIQNCCWDSKRPADNCWCFEPVIQQSSLKVTD